MKLSDYIVDFFISRGTKDFFGYQGTMIAHLVDSIGRSSQAVNHVCYNEQGAAFAACGYASTANRCGVAYATSGPGALNLVSGIANAYYDSIPVIFITGQINTYEYHGELPELRQASFQETKAVEICRPITKYAVQITDPAQIRYELEKAYCLATTGRKGPVLLDIPMNIQRADIEPSLLSSYEKEAEPDYQTEGILDALEKALKKSKRPVLLLGQGIPREQVDCFTDFAERLQIPMVTSLLAKGFLPYKHSLNFGYLGGAYGHRYANMIVSGKSDLIIAIGCSLCTRQTGTNVQNFAVDADVIRFDIDSAELKRKIKSNEISFLISAEVLAELLRKERTRWSQWNGQRSEWLRFCREYKRFTEAFDQACEERYPNQVVDAFNPWLQPGDVIVSDVGQHMMWIAQSVKAREQQHFLFSGGHGAMGYALPAAIGASSAISKQHTVYCFCGDGAFQMNIQELQTLKNENCDAVIVVFNNFSLGLIAQQQDAYFDSCHFGSTSPDFIPPSFASVAKAYGINSICISKCEDIHKALQQREKGKPFLIEYLFDGPTKAVPKTVLGQQIYDQEPRIPQEMLEFYLSQ